MSSFFDAYNIRARLFVGIIYLSPIILSLYLLNSDVRNISTTAIIVIIALAISNYIIIFARFMGKKVRASIKAAEYFLYPNDKSIDQVTKQRYYRILANKDASFNILLEPDKYQTQEFRDACKSAIQWLKFNTRDNKLIMEENINYGFCRNLYGMKRIGIITTIVLFATSCIIALSLYKCNICNIPNSLWLSLCVNIIYILLWTLGVNKHLVEFSSENYSIALLGAIDSFQ